MYYYLSTAPHKQRKYGQVKVPDSSKLIYKAILVSMMNESQNISHDGYVYVYKHCLKLYNAKKYHDDKLCL